MGRRIVRWICGWRVAVRLLLAVLVVHALAISPALAFPSPARLALCEEGHGHGPQAHAHPDERADHSHESHPHASHPADSCCTLGCGPAVLAVMPELGPHPLLQGEEIALPHARGWRDTIFGFDRPPRASV